MHATSQRRPPFLCFASWAFGRPQYSAPIFVVHSILAKKLPRIAMYRAPSCHTNFCRSCPARGAAFKETAAGVSPVHRQSDAGTHTDSTWHQGVRVAGAQKDMLEDVKRTSAYYNAVMNNRAQFAGKVRRPARGSDKQSEPLSDC